MPDLAREADGRERQRMLFGAVSSAIAWLALAWTAAPAPVGSVAIGDVPEYRFRAPPIGAPELASLADLRGRPVLLEFWGRR